MHSPLQLRLGTRASVLARWQAEWVRDQLVQGKVDVELVPISTRGDQRSQMPIDRIGGQGVFTKELQRALLDGRIDLAVHSLKDLPTDPIDGLVLAAVPQRASPWDVLAAPHVTSIQELPEAARVATGSLRRRTQLLHVRPDFDMIDIRGNVETRLQKLDAGGCDALILAEAGLRRLGLADRITQMLTPAVMLPAIGQGALGIEIRAEDPHTREIVARLDEPLTRAAVTAERSLLATLRGGCLAPVGAWGRIEDEQLHLEAVVLSADGSQRLHASLPGNIRDAEEIGQRVAHQLINQGATRLISQSRTK